MVRDVLGREWQLGTVQVDYNLPIRFGLEYIGSDNQPHRPVMVHRAPFGSMERFVGVLIEHFAGAFPTWLAPTQVCIVPVGEKFVSYAQEVLSALKGQGIRAEVDASAESFNKRVRAAITNKIPNIFILGGREEETRGVTWRRYGREQQLSMSLDDAVSKLSKITRERLLDTHNHPDLLV